MNYTFKVYFSISLIILVLVIIYGILDSISHENHNYISYNKNFNKSRILHIKVPAIGITGDNSYGTIYFDIYLVPKNKFFDNVSILLASDKTTLGNSFQDYLKNVRKCLNKMLNDILDNYIIYIKGSSNFSDVDGGSGSVMIALGIYALLKNETLDSKMIATGVVDNNCNIGPIEGLKTKLYGVEMLGFKRFYVPFSNYNFIKEEKGNVTVIPVKNLNEVIKNENL